MNKRIFISFGLVALLLVIVIPFWAFSKDGSDSSSPEKVAASDDAARAHFQTNCGSCHTLARAGTDGVVGPNLDERQHRPSRCRHDQSDRVTGSDRDPAGRR